MRGKKIKILELENFTLEGLALRTRLSQTTEINEYVHGSKTNVDGNRPRTITKTQGLLMKNLDNYNPN